jgi:hypothetical protein
MNVYIHISAYNLVNPSANWFVVGHRSERPDVAAAAREATKLVTNSTLKVYGTRERSIKGR